jgi:hypothetical protein
MSALALVRKKLALNSFRRTPVNRIHLVLACIACVSTTAIEPITANAQEWVPRNVNPISTIAPVAQASGATHLVIEPPQQPRHRHSSQVAAPQFSMPTHQESVGGGYWNQPDDVLSQPIVSNDETMVDDQFGGAELPAPTPPKKKINLTHVFPGHPEKTPRSTAIPQASRTTGWKQPYSYGHFGAKHNRQWSVHHGHQRSHTQWTFR